MSNEIIKEELSCRKFIKLEPAQTMVENRLSTEDEISKVLTINSTASILHSEVIDGEVRFSGKLRTEIVYLNSANNYRRMSGETEWAYNYSSNFIRLGSLVCAKANVIDVDINSITANEVSLNNVVEFNINAITSQSVNVVVDGTDGVYVLNEPFTSTFITSENSAEFDIEFEIDNKQKISEILYSSSFVGIKKFKSMNGVFCIEGQFYPNLVISLEGGEVKILNEECNFSEEIINADVNSLSAVDGTLTLVNLKSEINGGKIILTATMRICYNVNNEKTINMAIDAFSVTNQVGLTFSTSTCNRLSYSNLEEVEISGNAIVNDSDYEIRKIIGTLPKSLVIANSYIDNSNYIIEGIATFSAIYIGVEDDVNSVDVELPFISKIKNSDITDESIVNISASISDIKAKIRKANEIEISSCLNVFISVYTTENIAYLSDIALLEAKEVSDNALTLYIVKKGDTLFGIAKKLGINLEEILSQNPEIAEEPQEGEQIIIYKQKTAN